MRSYIQMYAFAFSTSSSVVSRTTWSLIYAHCRLPRAAPPVSLGAVDAAVDADESWDLRGAAGGGAEGGGLTAPDGAV